MKSDVHLAALDAIPPVTLYEILRLRAQVFVVEQQCVYLDPDGRDTEAGARHAWIERGGEVVAALRMLSEPDATWRVGRVVVRGSCRGEGLADRLMAAAISHAGDRAIVLDAQSPLVGWYQRLGFSVAGDEFVEDGIRHTPMRRAVRS